MTRVEIEEHGDRDSGLRLPVATVRVTDDGSPMPPLVDGAQFGVVSLRPHPDNDGLLLVRIQCGSARDVDRLVRHNDGRINDIIAVATGAPSLVVATQAEVDAARRARAEIHVLRRFLIPPNGSSPYSATEERLATIRSGVFLMCLYWAIVDADADRWMAVHSAANNVMDAAGVDHIDRDRLWDLTYTAWREPQRDDED